MMEWKNHLVGIARPIARALSLPPMRRPFEQASYSAYGEDRIVLGWLRRYFNIDIANARYCDIGANHPMDLNNTFLFYSMGASGVLVEPNPDLGPALRQNRPRDTILAVGVAFDDRRSAKHKRLTSSVFNTFSADHAGTVAADSRFWPAEQRQDVIDEVEVPLITANELFAKYFATGVDFLSLDAEGVDLQILRSIDFDRFKPKVLCFEAHNETYRNPQSAIPAGYDLIAKTPDNLICIDVRNAHGQFSAINK